MDPTALKVRQAQPLIVDLDGTLVRSDLLIESAFAYLGRDPLAIVDLLSAAWKGRASLKSAIAREVDIDVSLLPYDENVLDLIRHAREVGQPVYLASASNERYVRDVAAHLGLFDGWYASNSMENLSSRTKARRLVAIFGEGTFDYVGNGYDDLPVWAAARHCIAVNPSPAVQTRLLEANPNVKVLETRVDTLRSWVRLLRIHQWPKNALVFVALVTSQHFGLLPITQAIVAFLAFSLMASAIYIINDVVDLNADRRHISKRYRPLAAGTVPIKRAIALVPVLLILSVAGVAALPISFAGVLLAYFVLTSAYTFILKRKLLVDVLALAALYTIRVIGGAAAITVPVSVWLLGFSMFVFTALALIKRYVELASRIDENLSDPPNRNYRKSDLDIVATLAAAASFNAVTVFALYISSEAVRPVYRNPELLWLICPILMYWLGRALLLAHRRHMDDDPVVFALRDWNSYVALGLVALILVGAR